MLRRELGRIRTRLLAVNLVVLVVPVAGLELARVYERQLLGALERDMRNQAVLVREMVEEDLANDGSGPSKADLDRQERIVEASARQSRTRIRLLDRAGEMLVDSHRHGPPEGEEPEPRRVVPRVGSPDVLDSADRPWPQVPEREEVRTALAGSAASYTRIRKRSPSVILFVTEPIRHQGQVRGVVYVTRSTQPVMVELYRIRTALIRLLIGALAFTVIVTIALAWTISRPLSRLANAARRIASGQRDVVVPVEGRGEVRALGEAFKTMTEKLEDRLRYISEFSADVAHELKSPLTSIRGAAELLAEGAAEDPNARERFLRNIQLDTERLDRLVSRLLELSRIEASNEPMQAVEVKGLIDRVIERTHSTEQPVELRGDASGLVVTGRALDLERALLNLVENAIRFSPVDAPVTIQATRSREKVTLTVCDTGPGVPKELRTRIFDRFFTTDAERSGTGLGLAIVQAVAESHGGHVEVESAEGEGARFSIVLPYDG